MIARQRRIRADRQPPPLEEIDIIEEHVEVTDLENDPAVIALAEMVERAAADRQRKAVTP